MMPLRGKEVAVVGISVKDNLSLDMRQRAEYRPHLSGCTPPLSDSARNDPSSSCNTNNNSMLNNNKKVAVGATAIPSSSLGKKRTRRETLPDIAKRIPVDSLRPYLMMSLVSAAKSLGISATTLKRLCRHYGIKRWPFRQISGIDRTVGRLQAELQASLGKRSSQEMLRPIAAHIHELHLHRQGMVELALEGGHEPIRGKLASVGMFVNAFQGNTKSQTSNHVRSPSMSSTDSILTSPPPVVSESSPIRVPTTTGGGQSQEEPATKIITPPTKPSRPLTAVDTITTHPQRSINNHYNHQSAASDASYSFPLPGTRDISNSHPVSVASLILEQGSSEDHSNSNNGGSGGSSRSAGVSPGSQRSRASIGGSGVVSSAGGGGGAMTSVAGAIAEAVATVAAAAVSAEASMTTSGAGEGAGRHNMSLTRDPCDTAAASGTLYEHNFNNHRSVNDHPGVALPALPTTSLPKGGISGNIGVQLAPLRACWPKDVSSTWGDGDGGGGGGGGGEASLPPVSFPHVGCDEANDLNALETALGFGEQLMGRSGVSIEMPESQPQPNLQYHDYDIQHPRRSMQQQHHETVPPISWPTDDSYSIMNPCYQDEFDPTATELLLGASQHPAVGARFRGRASKRACLEHRRTITGSMTTEDFNAIGELVFGTKADTDPAAAAAGRYTTNNAADDFAVTADAALMYGAISDDVGVPSNAIIAAGSGGGSSSTPGGGSVNAGGGAASSSSAIDMDLELSTYRARVVETAQPSLVSLPDSTPWEFSGSF